MILRSANRPSQKTNFQLFFVPLRYSAFRPAARRLLSIRPNASFATVSKLRPFTTTQSIAFSDRPTVATASLRIQRRWNSDEASKNIAEKFESETTANKSEAATEASLAEDAINSVNEGAATTSATASTPTSADELMSSDALQNEWESPRESLQDNDLSADADEPIFPKRSNKSPSLLLDGSNINPKETVFVGNLFFDVTAAELKAKMEAFGVVNHCVIVHDNRGMSKG